MDPITAGLISGGAGLLGNVFSAQQSGENVDKQLAFAQQQQNWQTQMSNTAYQRASADMKAAGLNPMMMFGSGSSAQTPGQISAPNFSSRTNPLTGLGQNVESAVHTAISAKTFEQLTQQIANMKAQEAQTQAQTITEGKRPGEVQAITDQLNKRIEEMTQAIATRKPAELEARGVTKWIGAENLGLVGAGEYGVDKLSGIAGRIISNALGVNRLRVDARKTKRWDSEFEYRYGSKPGE